MSACSSEGSSPLGASSRRTLVFGRSVRILTMMQSYASAAKLRAAGPFSPSASVPCQLPVPATSDRQSTVRAEPSRERRIGKKMLFPRPSACRTQDDALQCLAGGDKAPERDEQLACQRDNHRLARAGSAVDSTGLVPTGPVRSPSETTESARRVGSCHGGPGRCRLWRVLVLAASRHSRPASLSGQRSAPLLFGHALAARAPHGPACLPFQCRRRRPEPGAVPWRVARSRAPAPIVPDEPPRSP